MARDTHSLRARSGGQFTCVDSVVPASQKAFCMPSTLRVTGLAR